MMGANVKRLGLVLAMALSGCGQAGGLARDADGDRFAPGTWQMEAWLESDAGSARGDPGATLHDTVKLSPEQADNPPASVFFNYFYHGAKNPDVRFKNGKVEGSFHQGRVDDIAAHNVPITGTYSRDRFRVTFGYKAFGAGIDQVVEGKLVKPAS